MQNLVNRLVFLLVLLCFSCNIIRIGSIAYAEMSEETLEFCLELLETEDDETKIIDFNEDFKSCFAKLQGTDLQNELIFAHCMNFHYNEPFIDLPFSPPEYVV